MRKAAKHRTHSAFTTPASMGILNTTGYLAINSAPPRANAQCVPRIHRINAETYEPRTNGFPSRGSSHSRETRDSMCEDAYSHDQPWDIWSYDVSPYERNVVRSVFRMIFDPLLSAHPTDGAVDEHDQNADSPEPLLDERFHIQPLALAMEMILVASPNHPREITSLETSPETISTGRAGTRRPARSPGR